MGIKTLVIRMDEKWEKLKEYYPKWNKIVFCLPSSPEHTEHRLSGEYVFVKVYRSQKRRRQ